MSLADRMDVARNRRPAPPSMIDPTLSAAIAPTEHSAGAPLEDLPTWGGPLAPVQPIAQPQLRLQPQPSTPQPSTLRPEPMAAPEQAADVAPRPYISPAGQQQPYVPPVGPQQSYLPPVGPQQSYLPPVSPSSRPLPPAESTAISQSPEFRALRQEVSDLLTERMGTRLNDARLSEGDLDVAVRRELASIIDERASRLSESERLGLIRELADEALGLGPLQALLDDPTVSEIMVNGPEQVFVERRGRIQRVPTAFRSEERLRRVIERIVSRVGRRIDESSPLVDARLADGSRVNAIIPPLAVGGSSLTIRKFAAEPYKATDLVGLGTLTEDMVELLHACVAARLNIIVSGGTGTGKTTLLNVLSSFIPSDERIVTIEDSVELQLQQEHVVRLESRPSNLEGRGEVTIRDLVRNALRMRPDRIVIGECRGGETLDMLQSMNTGHDGSLSTLHANTPRDAIARLETLVLMAGMDLPHRAIREQIASAVDLIIHITRLRDGTRRVTHITEVIGMENDMITLQDVYRFDFSAGVDASGRFLGGAQPTGIRPRFISRFEDLGVPFDAMIFAGPRTVSW